YSKAGATLQGARVKEGLSQVELAEKLKISQTNLSKMENGKRPIGKNMAKRLSKVLNINYRVFL
ncbi:MAG: helix-turn-helix transcriptional regulator, partial [Bdellovibrionota bacterium]